MDRPRLTAKQTLDLEQLRAAIQAWVEEMVERNQRLVVRRFLNGATPLEVAKEILALEERHKC